MPRRNRGDPPTQRQLTAQEQMDYMAQHAEAIAQDIARVATGRRSRIARPPITREMYRAMIPRNENPSSLVVPVDEDPCGDPC